MPIEPCRKNGQPGFRWGKQGACYIYTPGDMQSKERAKEKARKQGQAIKVNQKEQSNV